MTKLFIGGFPLEMTELEVVQLVAPYADVSTIKLVRDKVTKICKGYGFIEVTDETHALNAISNLDGMEMGDRVLSLNIAPEKAVPKAGPFYRKAEPAKRPRRPRL
jgi:RNA recognition motif-containing protein